MNIVFNVERTSINKKYNSIFLRSDLKAEY